jgi:hypothetical protein
LGLAELETDYFLGLIQLERAGTTALKTVVRKQLKRIRDQALELSNRLPQDGLLTEEDKAIFYSNWFYSGIRLMTSIPRFGKQAAIAAQLGLPKGRVAEVVEFLLSRGLCIEEKGEIRVGPSRIHLESTSPHVTRHHTQWRLKALEKQPQMSERDLVFTAPLTVSAQDAAKIRERMVQLIEEVSQTVGRSEPEQLNCLNIDWIQI